MSLLLLDTNIISDFIRRPRGHVAAKLMALGEASIATSMIVAAELRFGARKKDSDRLTARVEEALEAIPVYPFDAPADRAYASLRSQLERDGTPISAMDMLIAAHALALDATLVTDNLREFERVGGLRLENWLR